MASNLRVDQITSSTTGSVSIGTATFTGGLSGDITGLNVTGVITATTLNQNLGAGSSITIGDTFIKQGAVGLGTTDTAGRNAGVGTATGTLIYNTTTDQLEVYTPGGWQVGAKIPFTATGGTEDTSSRSGYKIHTFSSPGSLIVSGGSKSVEYLIVGGGGGAGAYGGGGAGGMRTGSVTLSPGTYPVIRGAGGGGSGQGGSGVPSVFNNTGVGISSITSEGGGGGAPNGTAGQPGGSGGGGGGYFGTFPGGTGNRVAGTSTPVPSQGNDGGAGTSDDVSYTAGGGGGGAGAVGGAANTPAARQGGNGGDGSSSSITGSSVTYAGGGGGATNNASPYIGGTGGSGGGGNGAEGSGTGATAGTDGLGGGGGAKVPAPYGLNGGSGIVIIAYPTS